MPASNELFSLVSSGGLLAYVGLGPGQEFIPQFLALLALAGTALLAVIQWPFALLLRRFARNRNRPSDAAAGNTVSAKAAESNGAESGDKP